MKNNENGRSMIEMLGVLAVAGVLTVGAIAMYSKALATKKSSDTITQASDLITNIHNKYASRRNYRGLEAPASRDADTSKLVPPEMWSGTKIKNKFGGKVLFKVNSNEKKFDLLFTGINNSTCIKLVTTDWGENTIIGADPESGTSIDDITKMKAHNQRKLTIGDATTGCACGNANTCSVQWLTR